MALPTRALPPALAAALLLGAADFTPAGDDPIPKPTRLGRTLKPIKLPGLHNRASVVFSPDGKRLAWVFAEADKTDASGLITGKGNFVIHVWDIERRLPVQNQRPRHEMAFAASPLRFTPDGEQLILGTWRIYKSFKELDDPEEHMVVQVRNWNVERDRELNDLENEKGYRDTIPYDVALNDKGDRLTIVHLGGGKIVEYPSNKEISSFTIKPPYTDPVLSGDGRLLAAVTDKGKFRLWQTSDGKELHSGEGFPLVFTPDGKALAVQHDGKIHLWDTAAGKSLRSLPGKTDERERWLAFTADGKRMAWNDGGKITLADPATAQVIATINGEPGPVAFAPDGDTLAVATRQGNALLWDLRKLRKGS